MDTITSIIILIAGYYAFMFLFDVVVVPVFTFIIFIGAIILHWLHIIRLQ